LETSVLKVLKER